MAVKDQEDYTNKLKEPVAGNQGDGSAGKALAGQVCRPEFESPAPCKG